MGSLDESLTEAKVVYWVIRAYNIALDWLVGFLASAIVLVILGLSMPLAILPAVLYAIFQLIKSLRSGDFIGQLAGKYENIDQRLQTAIEYKGARNVIVEDLLADVSTRMDSVETSTFYNSRSVSRRVLSISVLSFLLLTATALNLHAVAFDSLNYLLDSTNSRDALNTLTNGAGGRFFGSAGDDWNQSQYGDKNKPKLGANPGGQNPGMSEGPTPGKGSGTGADPKKDIYGQAKSANIAGKDVDFRLHPEYGGDIEIRETGPGSAAKPFVLDDVQSVDECVECVVGPEHEEVVRKYFEKILPET